MAQRFAALGQLAGLAADDVVPNGRWIYLEAEAGEPVFQSERDTPWGESGTWTVVDEEIVGSSLGMGLLRQAQAAEMLVASADAKERYVGWALAEAMANKLIALDRDLTVRPESGPSYIPHATRALGDAGQFEVADGASVLFDQVSLLWGAARTLQFLNDAQVDWPASEQDLATALEAGARALLSRAADAIASYHIAADGRMVGRSPASADGVWVDASTVDVALLVLAVDAALPVGGSTSEVLRLIQTRAVPLIANRQGADGRFAAVSTTAGVDTELASQFAGMYALLTSGDIAAASRTFDFLEQHAWDDWKGFGLYRWPNDAGAAPCYTALDMGLAVGALRELASRSEPDRRALIMRRLAAFVRSVLDDAALELDNAGDASTTSIVAGDGRGTLFGIQVANADALVPVLQRSLCLVDVASETSCGGLRILPDDPWYQTDIAMYASYVIRASSLGREDDADANLAAVDFHSGLGVPFDAYSSLSEKTTRFTRDAGSSAALEPIVVPFYAGDPYLGAEGASNLAWNPSSFDARVVPSAIGMTLLREAQEIAELAHEANRSPEDELAARVLAASVGGKLAVLDEDLVLDGPEGVRYVAHAYAAAQGGEDVRMDVVDRTSDLFDQASLLFGLTELIALVRDPAAAELFADVSAEPASLAARAEALVDVVLGTLEMAHRRPTERVLADLATPRDVAWVPGSDVSATSLGLMADALAKTIETFGAGHPLASRARALLGDEVAFLRSTLWDGSGGYREAWTAVPSTTRECASPSLSGQLGALSAFLALDRLVGGAAAEIRSALLAFETRFWDPAAELYVSRLDHLAWCMTPLDLALAVGVVPRAARYVDAADAQIIESHLVRHVDRALDAVNLQIPARSVDAEGRRQTYAPVFDRRVCLEPPSPLGLLTWTRAGDLVRYTVQVENPTEETFIGLTLDDLLPEGVALVAINPAASVDGGSLRWTLDRLEPGAVLSWQIDVRVASEAALGDVLTNCATLAYTDEAGLPRPTRDACASVTLDSADGARAAGLRSTSVFYRTDEAMRLAVALEDLANQGILGSVATEGRAASLGNLGILLGESGLGVPFSLSPIWATPQDAWSRLEALADHAGLPGVPDLAAPISLPTAGGVPILERGVGFIEKKTEITPAALGWTLAREAQFLDAESGTGEGLTGYLLEFVGLSLEAQVAWLDETAEAASGATHFVHAVTVTVMESAVTYDVSDPRSLAYDQASLLVGLARVAAARGVDAESSRRATNLAAYVLSDLARHVTTDGVVLATLDAGSLPASWFDAAVVAHALSDVAASVPRLDRQAKTLLAVITRPARDAKPLDPKEELARIDLLLVAARCLGDGGLRNLGLSAWKTYAATSVDRSGRITFSAPAMAGWRYTPAELALALEVLGGVVRADADLALGIEEVAADLVRVDLFEEHVQLWSALGYWSDHVGVPCFDAAPVFAVRPGRLGSEPIWRLRRP